MIFIVNIQQRTQLFVFRLKKFLTFTSRFFMSLSYSNMLMTVIKMLKSKSNFKRIHGSQITIVALEKVFFNFAKKLFEIAKEIIRIFVCSQHHLSQ